MKRQGPSQQQMKLKTAYENQYPNLSDQQMQHLSSWKTPDHNQQTPKQIIHKVVYGDTLEGLCLTYNVSIGKIKQRNKIQSDSIYYLKQIIIPNPSVDANVTSVQTEYMKIQQFIMYMDRLQKSQKTARYYLSQNDWNVQKAVTQYRKDLQWQKKNKLTSIPLANYNPLKNLKRKNQ